MILGVQGDTHNVYPSDRCFLGRYYFIKMCTAPHYCTEGKYENSIDWDAKLYIGITLKLWYNLRRVQLSMPTYFPDAIKKIKNIFSVKTQDAPAAHLPPKLGKRIQS